MKVIIRLLGTTDELLGWAEVVGVSRGDGSLWSTVERVEISLESAGTLAVMNVHWTDMNVNIDIPLPKSIVEVGQVWSLRFTDPLFRLPSSRAELPAVTVRDRQEVTVPAGVMSARTH